MNDYFEASFEVVFILIIDWITYSNNFELSLPFALFDVVVAHI